MEVKFSGRLRDYSLLFLEGKMRYEFSSANLETDILLAAARKNMTSQATKQLNYLSKQVGCNWLTLVQLAMDQGVLALVGLQLNNLADPRLPDSVKFAINMFEQSSDQHNRRLLLTLHKALNLIHQAQLRVIPYKGLILAASVYGDVNLRKQSCDVDLLIHEDNYLECKKLLLSQGYTLENDLEFEWECGLRDPEFGFTIDLHRTILPELFGCQLDFDVLWDRRVSVELLAETVPSFSAEDLLVILSLNVWKDAADKSIRLYQLCDIFELLNKQNIDWQVLLKNYQYSPQGLSAVKLAILSCRWVYNLEIPYSVWVWAMADSLIVRQSQILIKDIFNEKQYIYDRALFLRRYFKVAVLQPNAWAKWQMFHNYVLKPNHKDYAMIALSDSWQILYYPLRFIRLCFNHIFPKSVAYFMKFR